MCPAVVLLHGFTQTGAAWREVIGTLGERYRAIAPDLRGHGTASARRPVEMGAVIADLAALAPPRFTLAGYSMGGRVALAFALAHPARVARLVLVGASPGLADPGERARRRAGDERLARDLEREGLERFADRWGAQPLFAGQPPAVAAAARADRLRNTAPGLAAALRGLGTGAMTPLWDRLGELAMPVALLAGERDARFVAVAGEMAVRIPGARVEVVADAGHAAHLEAPGAVAAAIRGE